ncbi:leucine-rich repeat domain-containing protein [Segatella copri]|uniref:leucine-rich repeat domain-containing protein n=1 Tax=Segatella copri TaxID=165179 RepID=UPI003F7033BE
MKTMTLKGLFLCLVFLLYNATSHAADDLITWQITIKLDKAGTLPDKIGSSKKYKITNLKIVGEINGTDWRLIRDMAGRDFDTAITPGELSVLDLSEAKIVSGGSRYDARTFSSTYNNCIGENAFNGCCGLTSIILPSGVTSIGAAAFKGCSGLTSLTISPGVTEIGNYAFEGCSGLTSLTIPPGITSISDGAFKGCSGLTSLTIPPGVTEIGRGGFADCSALTSISLPSSLTSIYSFAFSHCSSLTSLTIPSGVTRIGDVAFDSCSALTSISLPSSLTSIGDVAFQCCNVKEVRFYINGDFEAYLTKGHPYIGCHCGIKYYLNDEEITSIVVPSSITTLGKYAFQGCSNLLTVYVSWPTPISAYDTFSEANLGNCTLYVPQGTEQDYFLADGWGDFGNIVEYDPTGIDMVTTSTDAKELSRYSVNGQRLSAPAKGLNIVKYSDGSVKKVVVQ